MRRSHRTRRLGAWPLYLLGLLAAGVAVLAVTQIGPPSSSARTAREVVTAENGVVQSSVTGSGNVAAGDDVDVNFQTSGTLAEVYVSAGQHVSKGQLLATLDPTSAQLAVDQAQASLNAAEDQLTAAENGTSTGSSGTSSGTGATGTTTSFSPKSSAGEFVAYTPASNQMPKKKHKSKPSSPSGQPPATTTTTTTSSSPTRSGGGQSAPSAGGGAASSGGARSSGSAGSGVATTTSTTPSPASIASAQASVYSAQANLQNAENTLTKTKLYAPIGGTIVSLADVSAGDSISAGSTGAAAATGSSTSSGNSGATGTSGSNTAGSLGGSSSSSTSGAGSGSSPFAEIVNTGSMTMTVAFSESDISKVMVGQAATVTIDAISGLELTALA